MTTATISRKVADWISFYQAFSGVYAEVERALIIGPGLSLPQMHTLIYLEEHSQSRETDLAAFLRRQGQTMTGLMDRLERHRLAKRQQHPTDRRAFLLSITPEGRDALARALPVMEETLASTLGTLTVPERETLRVLAGRIGTENKRDRP